MKKIINNIEVELTAEELAQYEERKARKLAEKQIRDTEQAQKEADALAGNNKLLELGLTQAQVTAMTGYTPPVSE